MPVLTDITDAAVKKGVRTLQGKILSKPALLISDGVNLAYACDVDVSIADPSVLVTGNTTNTTLHNVPISRANYDLIYADVGNPVTLQRTACGRWEITGFSEEIPGTHTAVPVNLGTMTIGTVQNLGTVARPLTLAEIGIYAGGFGTCPLGASALFTSTGVFIKLLP